MIYLDSAATTLKKPASVPNAVKKAVKKLAGPGRGGHRAAMLASETAFKCRETAAELFSVQKPENIVFTSNATHALNIAIKTLAGRGDRVVVSGYEHNSVIRPLQAIGAQIVVASSEPFEPEMAVHAFESRLAGDTKLVVCNHVSNVFGYILPLERICNICRRRGVPFIIDASQSAGVLEIDADKLGADFIAMPGHKGLYGPQGTGILICYRMPKTLLEGGTGSNSIDWEMPDFLPDRSEAGTHNMPGIAGLIAGMEYIRSRSAEKIFRHEQMLTNRVIEGMITIPGVRVFRSEHLHCQAGVVSFNIAGTDCEMVSSMLSEMGVAVRSGLHCSPVAHESAGTLDTGTVRVSFSDFNTKGDVNKFLNILEGVSKKLK